MDETTTAPLDDHVTMAVDIVSAYVSNNVVPVSGVPDLITNVHAALVGLSQGQPTEHAGRERATSAQIKKSTSPDALISFEDGKPYKTLKRHLTLRGLTPETYRAKHGLPVDYPMTSAAYSAQRSDLARNLGLGQQRRKVALAPEPGAPTKGVLEKPKRTGPPRKVVKASEE